MTKLTAITEDTTPGSDSLVYTVDDPSGTPTEKKVTLANLTTFSNIGIGSNYSDTFGNEPGPAIVFSGATLTDPAANYALKRDILYATITSNTSNSMYLNKSYLHAAVESGVAATGSYFGLQFAAFRNVGAADADDDGTLTTIQGIRSQVGHKANNAAATPVTSNIYGARIKTICNTGTITNLVGLHLEDDVAGGTVTNNFAIQQASTSAMNYYAGPSNLNNYVVQKVTVTTDNTDGVDTYTAAQLLGRLIRRGTGDELTAARIDVTDTAANIVAAIPGCQVGSGFEFTVNNEDSTHTIQVDGGTGVTMSPNDPSTAIPANSSGRFVVEVTNKTASSEAVTIHCIGITSH